MDDDTRAKVIKHYQKGQGSIQDIARVYHVTVNQVLEAIGEQQAATVDVIGDQVDQSEIGSQGTYNPGGSYQVPYNLD